ncbi:rCG21572 [Rattus norvegicus]|uniref:RCG21572 n=1 Tax=Rattus norvegicus TaxID=10116 RepID=A6J0V4_RAT|nr:rCG21572 [Rattus norvegicus]
MLLTSAEPKAHAADFPTSIPPPASRQRTFAVPALIITS